jgi:hypothetical protein
MEINASGTESGHPQDVSASAQKIVSEIKSLEKELEIIQSTCIHPTYSIKDSPFENSFSLRRICDQCHAVIGYPNTEEINKWVGP